MRAVNSRSKLSIQSGPCAKLKWSVQIPDSRYLLGNYEPELAKIVEKEVKAGKRFIDIGANAGYFSLLASIKGSQELKHLAVEPFPENVAFLKEHFFLNNIENVEVLRAAVANQSGKVEFSNSGNLAANTYKKESNIFGQNMIEVDCFTFDAIALKHDLNEQCFIKIDVEGAELDVLQGAKSFLSRFHPNLLLATHDCHVPGVAEDCLKLLQSFGYEYELLEDEKIAGQADYLCHHVGV